MTNFSKFIPKGSKNFIFLGECGSGKSELAINFAMELVRNSHKKVHFFDMDMTKPLFRSRDLREELRRAGVEFHCQEQFMDAPTLVGGVKKLLKEDTVVIMDVGGDYIGARAIGGFSALLNEPDTIIYYVLNVMRPWSNDIEHIDVTLGKILGVSHINLEQVKLIDNPNIGVETMASDYLEGSKKMVEIIKPYMPIEFSCVSEDLFKEVRDKAKLPLVPIHLYLTYEWMKE